jgi:hypothetical protein
MACQSCTGGLLKCSFGAAPSALSVLPAARVLISAPAAAMMDSAPMLNILPFGTCTSLGNPMVVAATAAALGALTPMPCIPVVAAPWISTCPTVMIGNFPAVTQDSKLICMWGGMIDFSFAGQVTTMVG